MRTRNIGSVGTVEYIDYLTFIKDENYVKITSLSSTGTVGARIVLTNPSSETKTLEYNSETNEIVFDLYDTILALYDDDSATDWTMTITPTIDAVAYSAFTATFKVLEGKSFVFREHGSASTFYFTHNTDLNTFNIFSLNSGTMTYKGNVYNLSQGINTFNLQSTNPSDVEPLTIVTTGTDYSGGSLWNDTKVADMTNRTCYLVRQTACDNFNYLHVVYKDTDGCWRTNTGGILKESTTITNDSYIRNWDVIKNRPHKYMTANSSTITAIFHDIKRDSFFTDILYSDKIMIERYDGTYEYAVLNTTKLDVSKDDTQDYTLEFLTIN